ncbi:ABC transporter ATP-binding protein [Paenibacillus sp. MBLB4367]|uniref:ABC transporter ATP-binding protein n=1 Tax=Paenibacillus sp. MBLB4367 TaxID=3384767 RepID=UPI003907EFA6
MVLIRMESAAKTYRLGGETIKALDNVNLDIERGEFIAVMGPSGSGKSTLMNVLGCLDVLETGSYSLDGREVRGMTDAQLADIRNRKIGFVFQSFNLLPRLTAIENVELPLIYRGLSKKERLKKAACALAELDMQDRAEHKPSELSGGQQQRVAIARALAGDPPILLADEPTGALDTATGNDILSILRRLNAHGRTIVLITHDPAIAKQADRIIHIRDGRVDLIVC